MKNPTLAVVVLLASTIAAATHGAPSETGVPPTKRLLEQCHGLQRVMDNDDTDDRDAWNGAYCIGYVAGYRDMLGTLAVSDALKTRFACIPDHLSNGDVVKVFVAWAERNRDKLGEPCTIGLARALGEAYPCGGG